MINVRKISAFLLLACASLFLAPAHAQLQVVGDGGPGPVKAQHLTAELVSLSPDIAPGGTLQVGLVLTLEEHWHVYWINAGDSGEPPKITWTLPEGITAGPMLFPIPSRLPLGPLMDFGYEDEVAFPVQLTAASSLKPGPTHIDAKVTYLVCREVCIPGKAHLGLNLTVVPGAAAAQPVGALGEALASSPSPSHPTRNSPSPAAKLTLSSTSPPAAARPTPSSTPPIRIRSPTPLPSRSSQPPTAFASASVAPTTSKPSPPSSTAYSNSQTTRPTKSPSLSPPVKSPQPQAAKLQVAPQPAASPRSVP